LEKQTTRVTYEPTSLSDSEDDTKHQIELKGWRRETPIKERREAVFKCSPCTEHFQDAEWMIACAQKPIHTLSRKHASEKEKRKVAEETKHWERRIADKKTMLNNAVPEARPPVNPSPPVNKPQVLQDADRALSVAARCYDDLLQAQEMLNLQHQAVQIFGIKRTNGSELDDALRVLAA
jgi:hypothetical protein